MEADTTTATPVAQQHETQRPEPAQPAQPTQPEVTTGSLRITSTPAGAQIWIDGKNSGKKTSSSTTIDQLSAGKHKVELKMEGYETKTVDVSIEAGKTAQPADQKLTALEKPKVTTTKNGNKTTYTLTDSNVSFTMVYVPGGSFMMGAADDDPDANDNEKPAHNVSVKSFSLGETEVTQELWEAVMGNNPSAHKGKKYPVENVSWSDCQEFIKKLKALSGLNFRLPSESEWEYAARGGNNKSSYKYSGSNTVSQVARYNTSATQEVKSLASNSLGLYDMSGNVWEFCNDRYAGKYLKESTAETQNSGRVIRGGSYRDFDSACRVTNRKPAGGNNVKDNKTGFRLAL